MSENKGLAGKLPPSVQAIVSIAIGAFIMYYAYKAYVDLSHFNEHGGEIVLPRFMFVLNEIVGALGTAIALALGGLFFLFRAVKLLLGSDAKVEGDKSE